MMKLIEPGRRGPFWYIRGTVGGRKYEMSTGTIDAEDAADFLRRFLAAVPHFEREADERTRRTMPRAIELGQFETWLAEVFVLDGEIVRWWHDGQALLFHPTGGYLVAKVAYLNYFKRVREHRLKFLLAHGWLPESIDHIDRDRENNAVANLRAATPAMQAANTSRCASGGRPKIPLSFNSRSQRSQG